MIKLFSTFQSDIKYGELMRVSFAEVNDIDSYNYII